MRPFTLLIAAAAVAAVASVAYAASDKGFLNNALLTDNTEIQLGDIAVQRGDPQARAYGQMLVSDHTAHKAKVEPLAESHGITNMNGDLPGTNGEAAKLRGLSGRAFDHEFGRFMAQGHSQAIVAFQHEAASGQDPAVRKLASDTLPTLHKHLAQAQQLERS